MTSALPGPFVHPTHYMRGDLPSCVAFAVDFCDFAVVGCRASAALRRKNSANSQHAMAVRARQNGTTKYSVRNTRSPAISSSFGTPGSATSMAASNTPSEPGAWLAYPRSVADTKAIAMVRNSPSGGDGIALYMASAEQPRSATPIPIWVKVDDPPGSRTFQFLM